MRRLLRIAAYLLFVVAITVIGLEIALRVFHPFNFRQSDNEVILPRNRKMSFTNTTIRGIDSNIIHTKNSLGFRGSEPPADWQNHTTIIAMGGSTTECFYLNDDKCWTNLLEKNIRKEIHDVWINNAGFQGHSTFGNFILLNDYVKKLKPKYVLLLEGINEINRTDIAKDESVSANSTRTTIWGWLKRHSHLLTAIINIERHYRAERLGITDKEFDPATMPQLQLSETEMNVILKKQESLVTAYAKRLNRIIDTCVANKIQPVLITQPILYGDVNDCISGVDLAKVKIADGYNGLLMWKLIELYNNQTIQISKSKNLPCIDLAAAMPKCSKYFYDICHFTNEGSQMVSEIIAKQLLTFLK